MPANSYLRVKSMSEINKFEYYENLLQLTVRDETYIFEISDKGQKEINYIHKKGQLKKPQRFVDLGTS